LPVGKLQSDRLLAAGVQSIFAENLTMQNQDDATNPLNTAVGINANLNRGGVTQNFHIPQLYGCPTVSLHFRLPQSTERHPGAGQPSFSPQQGRIISSSVTIAALGQRPHPPPGREGISGYHDRESYCDRIAGANAIPCYQAIIIQGSWPPIMTADHAAPLSIRCRT
ncbi:MAG: hypothetical protein J2P48_14615, partial [Alphaproteobacteria bacterium]|nr:hypothetical protein [Alphaproteobacteria bacterium]